MKITIDRDACPGAGQCECVLAAVADLDDEGKVIMLADGPVGNPRGRFRNECA